MKLQKIKDNLKDYKPDFIDIHQDFAVNVLLRDEKDLKIVFQKRSSKLRAQPGEISLAGGEVNKGETPLEAAIRETEEELYIDRKNMEIISPIDVLMTGFNGMIYPFVTFYHGGPIKSFNRDEVDEVFEVPLDFLIKNPPLIYDSQTRIYLPKNFPYEKIQRGKDYPFRRGHYPIFFYEYGQWIIWGLTAKIVHSFISALEDKAGLL